MIKNFRLTIICLALAHLLFVSLQAEDDNVIEQQSLRFEQKLSDSVLELSKLNNTISDKKKPLLVELNRLRTLVAKHRNTIDDHLLTKAETAQALELAYTDVRVRENHLNYTESLIGDYSSNIELAFNIAEDQLYSEELTRLRLSFETSGGLLTEEAIDRRFEIIGLSLDRLERIIGGDKFNGQAIDEEGKLADGTFLLYGPTALFVSGDQLLSGFTKPAANQLYPVIGKSESYDPSSIAQVVDSGNGKIALDATLGRAASIESAQWSIRDHVSKGGYVGYAIIGFAGLVLLTSILKLIDFRAIKAKEKRDFSELFGLVRNGDSEKAIAQATSANYPLNEIVCTAISNRNEENEVVEELVVGVLQKAKFKLDRFLPFLAITAAATPLMGLLGTVVGMIKTFALITVFGSGEAKSLSSGISEALVTTEFGLLVAIPTLLIHGAFVRMSKERVGALEDFASDFVVGLRKLRIGGSKL